MTIQEAVNFDIHLLNRAVTENLALISFDLNHKVIYVNENFSKALGYSKEELIGIDHSLLCFPSFANSTDYQLFWKQLLAGKRFQDKVERKSKSGKSVWLEATYMPVFDEEHKNIVNILKVATDITQREDKIKNFALNLTNMASTLDERSIEGAKQSDTLINEISAIERYSKDNAQIISSLLKEVRQINNIVDIIKGISEQTHILAINAGIESARSGENGRSFMVIAKEIQKLSDQVKQSIKQVEETALLIISEMNKIHQRSDTLKQDIQVSQETVNATVGSFKKIAKAADQLNQYAGDFKKIL